MRLILFVVAVILVSFLGIAIVVRVVSQEQEDHSASERIIEDTLDEDDPLLVSLCVVTDNFSESDYERFKAAARLAADTFAPFHLDFYITAHEEKGFPKQLNRALVPLWRKQVEDRRQVECDIMALVTEKDYAYAGHDFAGLALYPWNGIFVDSFSQLSFQDLKRVIQHELGHIFKAEHVDTPGSVMQPVIGDGLDNWDQKNYDIILKNRSKFR